MADNKDDDFDTGTFGGLDWDDETSEPAAKGQAPKAQADRDPFADGDPFGEDAVASADPFGSVSDAPFGGASDEGFDMFVGDDDVFSAPPSPDDDVFAPPPAFSDSDEDPFGFQSMPTPTDGGAPAALGDPDDEFADLGVEGNEFSDFAAADGFDSSDGLFEDEPQVQPAGDVEDPFAAVEGADDGYHLDSHGDEDGSFQGEEAEYEYEGAEYADEQAQPAAKSGGKSLLSRLIMPLGGAAVLAVVGWVGYSTLLPMFSGPAQLPQTPPQVVEAKDPPFPTALPGQPGGMPVPVAQPDPVPQFPSGQLPVVEDITPSPVAPSDIKPVFGDAQPFDDDDVAPQFPGDLAGDPVPSSPTVTLPDLPSVPVAAQPQAPGFDDLIGDAGIGARPVETAVPIAAPQVPESGSVAAEVIERIEARLSDIEREVAALSEVVRRMPETSAPAALHPAASAPAADLASLVPPLKPEIIETATLRGVSRGVAWISTGSGVVEVKVGDPIPGGGTVTGMREYHGSWIVTTTTGIVVQ